MRIDVHAHYFPEEYVDFLVRLGSRTTGAVIRPPGSPLDERIAMLDEAGIDLQVLSVGPAVPYFERQDDAVAAARMANDLCAEAARGHGGRYAVFGSVPLPHVDAAIAEAARCLDELGFPGLTIGCSVAGRPLDDPTFEPFYAELDRRGTVLFLHPLGIMVEHGMAEYGLPWVLGAPLEDAVAALRLVYSGVAQRYPNLKIVVPHFGGVLPFLLERLDYQAEGLRARNPSAMQLEGPPSAAVPQLWFDTVNQYGPALRCACEAFGTERLVFGTDFPYLPGPRFKRCVTYVEEAGLQADDARAILDENAARLLGLPAR